MVADPFEVLSQRARHALADGNPTLARQLYLQSLGLKTDSPDAHYGLATTCFLLDDLEGAAYHFKEVTRLDPLRAAAYVNLGAVYNRMDQLEQAIQALRRSIQLDARRAEAYYNLGLVYRRKGDAELAIQAYREAVRINPRMTDAHFNLANLLLEMSRFQQAIAHYREALALQPGFEKARAGLTQAEAALQPGGATSTAEMPAPPTAKVLAHAPAGFDVNRNLDPIADGNVLAALHRTTIESDSLGREFLKLLEEEVEPAIKELSTTLLYPDKSSHQLGERIQRFEDAMQKMRSMQKNLQGTMKKLRQISDKLFE